MFQSAFPTPSGETFPRYAFSNQVKICVFVCGESRVSGITGALFRTLDTLLLVKRNILAPRRWATVLVQKKEGRGKDPGLLA